MKKRLFKNSPRIYFVYPGNINDKTGGYIYEKNILRYAKSKQLNFTSVSLGKSFPFPNKKDLEFFLKFLYKIELNSKIIIDGLALEGLYSIFNILIKYEVIALIHHPLFLEFKGKKSDQFLKLEKKYFKKINKFIVTSHQTKYLINSKFKVDKNKIKVIEPGITRIKKYKFIKRNNNNNNFKFLTCGSVIIRKNYYFLLKVFKGLDNFFLDIVGDTTRDKKYYNLLKKYINNNNLRSNIKFHGSISDINLSKLYSKNDCYISVSKYEGFGMSLANALIINKPIISYYTETIHNTLGKKGIVYFNEFKVDKLRQLIISNIYKDVGFKKINKDIKNNKRYFLTPNESAQKFIKSI